jgi:hypothetical protein
MGVQSFKNVNLSMIEIYKVLKDNFPEYNIELVDVPGSSSFVIFFPYWGRQYIEPHHYIDMNSEKYSIIVQYGIDDYGTFTGIYLDYYLRGENIYERIDELKEPMENIKNCLKDNFPEYLTENNFSENFIPLPIY